MKALSMFRMILFAGMLASLLATGCTPESSLLKERDFRNAGAGDAIDALDTEDESYDFEDSRDGRSASGQNARRGDDAGRDDGNSSLRKEKYYQTGAASWYGREFHGKKTASGERFDMTMMTAAHRTLPFGTVVRVRSFENGKTVSVRINDRGPYRGKRIIDLSHAAARELGMLKAGEAQVGIQISGKGAENGEYAEEPIRERNRGLEPVSDDYGEEAYGGGGGYSVQAGAFYSRRNADNLKMKIERMTENSVHVVRDGEMYKVRIEGLNSKHDVSRLRRSLSDEDIPSFEIK